MQGSPSVITFAGEASHQTTEISILHINQIRRCRSEVIPRTARQDVAQTQEMALQPIVSGTRLQANATADAGI